MDTARVDVWLWAVRLFKTRSMATAACRGGHVRVGGKPAKPSTPVRVGTTIEALVHDRRRVVEVVRLVDKRVSAPLAGECLVDHSPPPPPSDEIRSVRPSGTGRPTKRERRQLDRFRVR